MTDGERDTMEDDAARPRTLVPLSDPSPSARLVVLGGPHTGRRFGLLGETTLGRTGEDLDVCIDDPMVSRAHARLTHDAEGWRVRDLESRNGTFVNGVRVTESPIAYGDRLRVGHTLMLFSHHDPLEEQLEARQQFEAIGRLGATVAHDLNNLIGAVVACADHLRDQLRRGVPDPDSSVESLDDIDAAMQRSADLVRRLLAFSRRSPRREGIVDLSRTAEDAAQLVARSLPAGVTIELDLAPGCELRGDSTLLSQLALNLLFNARDAVSRTGGHLSVRTRSIVDRGGASVTGRWAELVVSDTGEGMDAETHARIFEPFFTTKGPERGTGLGLSIVLEAVTTHGGRIECQTAPGEGTTFSVRLPGREASQLSRTIETPLPTVVPPSRGTVLLVEDEPMVRRSLGRVVAAAGHQVVEAPHGADALAQLAIRDFDVVLLDLEMPVMGGRETLARLRRSHHDLPVLVMTGHTDESTQRELLASGADHVIHKPIEADALRRKVDEVLRAALARAA